MLFRNMFVSAISSACLFTCLAQGPGGPGGPGAAPDLSDLKTYLTLTDSQVTALTTIQQQERSLYNSVGGESVFLDELVSRS